MKKMKKIKRIIPATLVLLAMCTIGWSYNSDVNANSAEKNILDWPWPYDVYVTDGGNPVSGATVVLCNGSLVWSGTTSGSCGCTCFSAANGNYCLGASYNGKSAYQNVTLNGSGAWTLEIVTSGSNCPNCNGQ